MRLRLVVVPFACGLVALEPMLAPDGSRAAWVGGCDAAVEGRDAVSDAGSAAAPARSRRAVPAREQPRGYQSDRLRLRLVLNIPAYRLDVFEDGTRTRNYLVAVGTPQYPTPRGSYAITQVEWNPWWIPPLAEWARKEKVTPPGSQNPMGRVKLLFRTYYFLHGTPQEQSLGSASSHGCVRMAEADAIALARLVQHHAAPDASDAAIDSLLGDTAQTRRYVLTDPVPLDVRYDVVELRHDSLWLYPDVYGLVGGQIAAQALAAMANAGYDTAVVDTARLSAATREAGERPMVLALKALLLPSSTRGQPLPRTAPAIPALARNGS